MALVKKFLPLFIIALLQVSFTSNAYAINCVSDQSVDRTPAQYVSLINQYFNDPNVTICVNESPWDAQGTFLAIVNTPGHTQTLFCSTCNFLPHQIGTGFVSYNANLDAAVSSTGFTFNVGTQFHVFTFNLFVKFGFRMGQSFNPETDIPLTDLPLVNTGCLQSIIGTAQTPNSSNFSGQKCFGEGAQTGTQYVSWVNFNTNTSDDATNIAFALNNARDDSVDVYDQRDRDLEKLLKDNLGNIAQIRVSSEGGELKKADDDLEIYSPPNNLDDSPFSHSADIIVSMATDPSVTESTDIFDNPLGSNSLQEEIIEVLEDIYTDLATDNSNGDLNTTLNNAQILVDNLGNQVRSIDLDGRTLSSTDLDNIKSLLEGSGQTSGGSTIVVFGSGGSGSGGDGGRSPTDAGLPGGEADEAGDGTGSQPLPSDGFYTPQFPGDTLLSVFQGHYDTWQQSSLFTAINAFIPPSMGSALPQFCFSFSVWGSPCVDFNNYSTTFDFLRYIILLMAVYMSIMIVVTRTK